MTFLIAVLGVFGGTALGWYLRRKERWCPGCGGHLACEDCRRTGPARAGDDRP